MDKSGWAHEHKIKIPQTQLKKIFLQKPDPNHKTLTLTYTAYDWSIRMKLVSIYTHVLKLVLRLRLRDDELMMKVQRWEMPRSWRKGGMDKGQGFVLSSSPSMKTKRKKEDSPL